MPKSLVAGLAVVATVVIIGAVWLFKTPEEIRERPPLEADVEVNDPSKTPAEVLQSCEWSSLVAFLKCGSSTCMNTEEYPSEREIVLPLRGLTEKGCKYESDRFQYLFPNDFDTSDDGLIRKVFSYVYNRNLDGKFVEHEMSFIRSTPNPDDPDTKLCEYKITLYIKANNPN